MYDPSWLEGSRGIDGVLIAGNTFAAVGTPPKSSMAGILTVDADVTGLRVEDNVVISS